MDQERLKQLKVSKSWDPKRQADWYKRRWKHEGDEYRIQHTDGEAVLAVAELLHTNDYAKALEEAKTRGITVEHTQRRRKSRIGGAVPSPSPSPAAAAAAAAPNTCKRPHRAPEQHGAYMGPLQQGGQSPGMGSCAVSSARGAYGQPYLHAGLAGAGGHLRTPPHQLHMPPGQHPVPHSPAAFQPVSASSAAHSAAAAGTAAAVAAYNAASIAARSPSFQPAHDWADAGQEQHSFKRRRCNGQHDQQQGASADDVGLYMPAAAVITAPVRAAADGAAVGVSASAMPAATPSAAAPPAGVLAASTGTALEAAAPAPAAPVSSAGQVQVLDGDANNAPLLPSQPPAMGVSSTAGSLHSSVSAVAAAASGGGEEAAVARGSTPCSTADPSNHSSSQQVPLLVPQQQQQQQAGPDSMAAEAVVGDGALAAAEDFGLLSTEEVQQLVVQSSSSIRKGQTCHDVRRVVVRVGAIGPLYPAIMKTYKARCMQDGQEQLQRLLTVGIPTWRAMGNEVVRVVGAQVQPPGAAPEEIEVVRMFMVDKGEQCKDLGQLLKSKEATPLDTKLRMRWRAGTAEEAEAFHVVDCHGCLVPVQALLAGLVRALYVVHVDHAMVTRDMRSENVLVTDPELLGGMDSKEAPALEVLQQLVEKGVEVTLCDMDAYVKHKDQTAEAAAQAAAGEVLAALPPATSMDAVSLSLTQPGARPYFAPEVFRAALPNTNAALTAAAQVAKDPACDIWSMGVVLAHMIVRPYRGVLWTRETTGEIRLLMEPETRRAALGLDGMKVAEELLHVLDLCLVKDPRRRATIQELAALPVCQKGYKPALDWDHMVRALPMEKEL